MDKRKLTDELTELNVFALYDFMCPRDYMNGLTAKLVNNRRDDAIKMYQNDAIFYQRINVIVGRTLDIIERSKTMIKLPTAEKADTIAVGLSGHLDANEQAYFIAGFQEAINYLSSNQSFQRAKPLN